MYSGLHIGSQVSVVLAFHGHRMGLEGEVAVQAPTGEVWYKCGRTGHCPMQLATGGAGMVSLACGELAKPTFVPSPAGLPWLRGVGVSLLCPLQKLKV